MGHLFYDALGNVAHQALTNTGPFINLGPDVSGFSPVYWTGTESIAASNGLAINAWVFWSDDGVEGRDHENTGAQETRNKAINQYHVWAVRDGDVVTGVPEPSPLALVCINLAVLVVARRTWKTSTWRSRRRLTRSSSPPASEQRLGYNVLCCMALRNLEECVV